MAEILYYSGIVMFVFFAFLTIFLGFKLKVVDAVRFVIKPESYKSKERNKITKKKAQVAKKQISKESKMRSKVLHTKGIDMTEVLGEVFEPTEIINDDNGFVDEGATEVLEIAQNYATALLESSGTEFLDEDDYPIMQVD